MNTYGGTSYVRTLEFPHPLDFCGMSSYFGAATEACDVWHDFCSSKTPNPAVRSQ